MNKIFLILTAMIASACTVDADFSGTTTEDYIRESLPSKISFNGDEAASPGSCSDKIEISLLSASEKSVTATSDVSIELSTDLDGKFYLDSTCNGSSISQISIPKGDSYASFYFQASTNGNHKITASADDLDSDSIEFAVANSNTPYKLRFDSTIADVTSLAVVGGGSGFTVSVLNVDDVLIPTATDNISISFGVNAHGSAVLSGTISKNATAGVATFDDLTIDKAASGYVLQAYAPSLPAGNQTKDSNTFNVNPGSPTKIAFYQEPPSSPMATDTWQLQVEVLDVSDNRVTTYNSDTITIAIYTDPSPTTPLYGVVTRPVFNGLAVFPGISIHKAASGFDLAAIGDSGPINAMIDYSNSFNVTSGPPSKLAFITLPPQTGSEAGSAISTFSVEIQDDYGNKVTTATDTVSLAAFKQNISNVCTTPSSEPGNVNTTSNAATSGEVQFTTVHYDRAETFFIEASATGLSSVCSPLPGITVDPAIPSVLKITGPASGIVNQCSASPFTVTTEDAYGNISPVQASPYRSVNFGSTPGTFYSSAGCGGGNISTLDIPTSTSSGQFWYMDSSGGGRTISVQGTGFVPDSTSYLLAVQQVNVVAAYPGSPAWNDYIRNDSPGAEPWGQTGTPCTGAESGGPNACIHAGVYKMVEIPELSSGGCAGWSATDQNGWFNWVCDNTSTYLRFYSTGLPPNIGLSSLIVAAGNGWRQNKITVSNGGTTYESALAPWWPNPVTPTPVNPSSQQTLNTAGTIYTVPDTTGITTTAGYHLGDDRIGFVVMPGALLQLAAGTGTNCHNSSGSPGTDSASLLCIGASSGYRLFTWVEGIFDGNSTNITALSHAFVVTKTKFSRFQTVLVQNSRNYGVYNTLSANNYWKTPHFSNSGSNGFFLSSSSDNVFDFPRSSNNGSDGMSITNSSDNAIFGGMFFSNNSNGISILSNSSNNNLVNITSIDNGMNGIVLNSAGGGNTLQNILAVNNEGAGIVHYQAIQTPTYSSFVNLALVENGTSNIGDTGFEITNASHNQFTGSFINDNYFGASLGNCVVSGIDTGLSDLNCTITGSGNSTFYPSVAGITSNAFFQPAVGAMSAAILGKQSSDTIQGNLLGTAPYSSITDFLRFDNIYRGWGIDNAATFPNTAHRSRCSSGNCRIYDWRLDLSSTVIRNTTFNGISANENFVNAAWCPTGINGNDTSNNFMSSSTTPRVVFLTHATEIMDDLVGNDNGLCESYENCIYAPNYGAYQGSGNYNTNQCSFIDGTISGVEMFGKPTNGAL